MIPVQRKVNGKWEDFIIPIKDHNLPGDYFYCASEEALEYLYNKDKFKSVGVIGNDNNQALLKTANKNIKVENVVEKLKSIGVEVKKREGFNRYFKIPEDDYMKRNLILLLSL
jgi:hypothetical protein